MTDFDPAIYLPTIDAILGVADMTQVSVKRIRRALQELFDIEFNEQKKQINELILERYHKLEEDREEAEVRKRKRMEEADAKLAAQLQDGESNGRIKRQSTTKAIAKPKKKRSPNKDPNSSAISALELNLSPKLADLLNKTRLPRTQVVKEVWDYIKEHDLQNPEDRREILCDEKMQEIFGKKVSMFQMNKVLSNHLYKDDE